MTNLGSFGAARREYEPPTEQDTFDFAGETFSVRGPIPGMVHLTIGAAVGGKVTGADFAAAVMEAIRTALTAPAHETDGEPVAEDDSEWLRFHQHAVDRCATAEDLRDLAYELLGADTGRPTGRRSTSSTGSSPTGTNTSSSSSATPASPPSSRAAADSAG